MLIFDTKRCRVILKLFVVFSCSLNALASVARSSHSSATDNELLQKKYQNNPFLKNVPLQKKIVSSVDLEGHDFVLESQLIRLGHSGSTNLHGSVSSAPTDNQLLQQRYQSNPFLKNIPLKNILSKEALQGQASALEAQLVQSGHSGSSNLHGSVSDASADSQSLQQKYQNNPFLKNIPLKIILSKEELQGQASAPEAQLDQLGHSDSSTLHGSISSASADNQPLQERYQKNPFLKNIPLKNILTPLELQGQSSAPQPQLVQFGNGEESSSHDNVVNPFLQNINVQKTKTQTTRPNSISETNLLKVNKGHSSKGKLYTRCSLAQELHAKHRIPMQDIATWVCIAQHQSAFNTGAVGRQNGNGSTNYGLFQINDRYWCSENVAADGGKACGLSCTKLIDDNLSDDLRCVRIIYDEHTRISGDGFNAWPVYQSKCQNKNIEQIRECFDEKDLNGIPVITNEITPSKGKGKIYENCELAKELYHKHTIPMEQIPTWVCIAEHESNFKTSAIGRLNTDGSADHGLFQISDLFWCTHDKYGGKACNIPCDRLLDSDITDDVNCIKIIYEEHTRISGNGFNAWTVYQPHCRNRGVEHIRQCFSEKELKTYGTKSLSPSTSSNSIVPFHSISTKKGKIYSKCELAKELYHKHRMPMEQIPKWVCIAEHESSYNTAAVGRLNTDGSADHGLFQISDLFWCTHDQYGGKACNIPCDKLLDADISDDVKCIKFIYEEHTRLSGDGFTAWTVYKPHCLNKGMDHIKQCFSEKELKDFGTKSSSSPPGNSIIPHTSKSGKKGKIYSKCELAKELYHKHRMPMEQIPKWVCIAEHESSYNTAAVGRLNTDGSADHGLFQISDLFWCTHDAYGGKACNIPCDKLLDADISDDVKCIKIIHDEHTRISGDGFNAWTVYKPHCLNKGMDHIKQCFSEKELKEFGTKLNSSPPGNSIIPQTSQSGKKGKIYSKCELAKELYHKHRMPMEQIPKWVCIAEHESSYNTAAVGRLNTDGSADHGLFQISDLFWCTHDQYGGKACNIPCEKLLDADISDDVKCIKIIHDEHTRISGDGFNAWTVYKPHCLNKGMDHIKQCFAEKELKEFGTKLNSSPPGNSIIPQKSQSGKKGKIYSKCELAKELYHKHRMPMEQIPTWVCIAEHESSYNTAAVGRLNTDGSADHGLFQISDLFWCTHDAYGGKACNIPCDKLLDADISDDVKCIKFIHEEHTRLSGDGFTAWTVYKPHCRNKDMDHIRQCFSEKELKEVVTKSNSSPPGNSIIPHTSQPAKKGKIYSKCELAKELYHKHRMPMEQIPTWVCIAQHESSYNTAAVGRLNTDGSADHGLFQISDLFWCTHDQYGGKACNIPCDKLLDADISDDVKCIKFIHEEHTRLSGDGFTAWTVYKPHCSNKGMDQIKQCFSDEDLNGYETKPSVNAILPHTGPTKKGKIYNKCELAKELYQKHQMPMEQIPIWVCIAQHESSFNTAAVGRLNTDGSADHGLFQISDLFWCTHDQHGGKACNIPCDKLLDADISDDVKCIKFIHNEHTQLSGDGFNAWTVYKPHCRNRQFSEVRDCFGSKETELYEKNKWKGVTDKNISHESKASGIHETTAFSSNSLHQNAILNSDSYKHNPFLNGAIKITSSAQSGKPISGNTNNFNSNPFLSGDIKTSNAGQSTKLSDKADNKKNPFLSGFSTISAEASVTQPSYVNVTVPDVYDNVTVNSLKQQIKGSLINNKYIDSSNFRTTTTLAQKTITTTLKPKTTLKTTTLKQSKVTVTQNPITTKGTTARPVTSSKNAQVIVPSTTRLPTTPWNWENTSSNKTVMKLKTSAPVFVTTTIKPTVAKTTKLQQTTTSKLPTTLSKLDDNKNKHAANDKKPTTKVPTPAPTTGRTATTKSTVQFKTTTKLAKASLWNWSWDNNESTRSVNTSTTIGTTTKKPATLWTTRITSPTSWTTTNKPTKTTTKASVVSSTQNWRKSQQFKETTLTTTRKPTTTTTTTTLIPVSHKSSTSWASITTPIPKTTTACSWNNGNAHISSTTTTRKSHTANIQAKQTSKSLTQNATTTKIPATESTTSWISNSQNQKKVATTTTHKPQTTTMRTKATSKSSVSYTTTTNMPLPDWSWNSHNQKHSGTTTTHKPQTTTMKTKATAKSSVSYTATTKMPLPDKSRSSQNQKQSAASTTRKPQTTTMKTKATAKSSVPYTTTTKMLLPDKSRSSQNQKQSATTTTHKPQTSTMRATAKTSVPFTTTTKMPLPMTKATTEWSWNSHNQKQSAIQFKRTTKTPMATTKTASAWSWNNAYHNQSASTTTRKPQTTKIGSKISLSSAIQFSTTTKKPMTTTKSTTFKSGNNLNQQRSTTSIRQPQNSSTKSLTPTTPTTKIQTSTLKPKPTQAKTTTTTGKPTYTPSKTSLKFSTTQATHKTTTKVYLNSSSNTWNSKLQTSTTKLPQLSQRTTPTKTNAGKWQQLINKNTTKTTWQTTTTTKPQKQHLVTSSTTRKPQTTTLSWQLGKQVTTTKPKAWNSWQSGDKTTTTKAPITTKTTTKKPIATITPQSKTTTTKVPITTRITTNKPTATTTPQSKTTKTSTTKVTIGKARTTTENLTDREKYRKDPFSHPFFDKVRDQFSH